MRDLLKLLWEDFMKELDEIEDLKKRFEQCPGKGKIKRVLIPKNQKQAIKDWNGTPDA